MPARITKTSTLTGIVRTMEFGKLSQEEFDRRYTAYKNGNMTIEAAFHMLSESARQFIATGDTGKEWDKATYNPHDKEDAMKKWEGKSEMQF